MRRILLPLAALVAGLALTACGGDPAPTANPTDDTAGSGVLGTADATMPAPTASGDGGGSEGGSSGGGSSGGGSSGGTADEDCVTYDSQVLISRYAAGVHVILPDHGSELIRVYGGPADEVGSKALAVARLFNTVCYIGRGNSFDSPEFVYEYWREPSGATASPLLYGDDCVSYSPRDLRVKSLGAGRGYRVTDGTHDLQHFATEADARLGRTAIGLQDLLCYVRTTTPAAAEIPAHITYTFNSGD